MRNIADYTRVTDVLSIFLKLDAIPQDILEAKAEIGTETHNAIDAYLMDLGEFSLDPRAQKYFESFKKLDSKKYISKPNRWFCDDLMLTGEADQIYEDNGELVLVDFKTSYAPSKSWPLQGSAYCYLARKNGVDIKRIEFVQLNKEGLEPKVYRYEENFEIFLKALHVYRYFYPRGGRVRCRPAK